MITRSLPKRLPTRATRHLRAFRAELLAAMPGQVEQVILFGSRARGQATRHSDYDVAVLVRGIDAATAAQRIATDTAYPHLLAGVPIRPITLPHDYLSGPARSALALNIAVDGRLIDER